MNLLSKWVLAHWWPSITTRMLYGSSRLFNSSAVGLFYQELPALWHHQLAFDWGWQFCTLILHKSVLQEDFFENCRLIKYEIKYNSESRWLVIMSVVLRLYFCGFEDQRGNKRETVVLIFLRNCIFMFFSDPQESIFHSCRIFFVGLDSILCPQHSWNVSHSQVANDASTYFNSQVVQSDGFRLRSHRLWSSPA